MFAMSSAMLAVVVAIQNRCESADSGHLTLDVLLLALQHLASGGVRALCQSEHEQDSP